jgi:hypothetical protein
MSLTLSSSKYYSNSQNESHPHVLLIAIANPQNEPYPHILSYGGLGAMFVVLSTDRVRLQQHYGVVEATGDDA